jgi:hypothetical protein
MRYLVKATVNYPETEADTPDYECAGIASLKLWLAELVSTEPDATSFVITLCVKKD